MEWKGRDYRHGGGKAVTWRKRTLRRTPPMDVAASAPREGFVDGARFEFQKRIARIDWRTLHTIDVDRVIREVDIDTLESVLDTVAFGDIQGEDIRYFTEANFVKIFRLAQLMVEYLLHVQGLLADHKSGLLQSRANMEQKNEKTRSRFVCQRDALLQTRHELKQAKKSLKTDEVTLKVREENKQSSESKEPQVWQCPSCEKAFESLNYLDMHVAMKHQNKQEVTQDKILALVSTAEEATAVRVKAEMSFAVQTEFQKLRERYQADLQRAETNSNTQVQTLHEDLRQSNNQLREVQTRVEVLQAKILSNSPNRLHELGSKFSDLERQVKTLGQENSRLLEELNVAYTEVSDLQITKRQSAFALETQINDLLKENQHLRRTMSKIEEEPVALSMHKDRRVSSTRERWTDKDEALRALARPTTGRRRTEAVPEEPSEGESSPDPENLTHTTSPVKRTLRFLTPERTRISVTERTKKSAASKQIKLRGGGDNPTTVEEMRAKLEWEMSAAHEEQKKRQNAVRQLLAKELVKEKRKTGKRNRSEDTKSCKAATRYSYTSKSETPSESDDEVEKRTTPPENGDMLDDMNVREVAHTIRKTETETETETETQEETANDLSGKLSKELKRFGIASTTNSISEAAYKSISSALEMQRSVRMSQIHGDERQIVKYERDAVAWHTQMAVHDRDLVIVKSPFHVVTDSDSDHSNASEYSVEESGRSKISNESGWESREDSREREMKTGGARDVRSSEQSSPLSSESSDDIQETEVTYKSKNVNWAKNSKADGSVHFGPRSLPPEGRVQYVSRTNSSRNVRDPPSRGELIRVVADAVDHTRQSEEEEVDEDAFGLGVWDSDEDMGK